jgi:tetratricopeptide (TPR) repeat protein
MSDWNRTIELDPGNLPAHYNRGKLRIARGDVHGAIADFRKVAELDPGLKDELRLRLLSGQLPIGDSIVVIADRASIKAEGQVIDTAMRCTALLLRGETGDQLQVRYRSAGMIDRTDAMPLEQAIAHFAEVIRRQPEDGGAYGARGNAWAFKGNFEKAVADHEQAIRLGPQDPLAYQKRGIAYGLKGDRDKALADFNQAIRLDPKDASLFLDRARIWMVLEKYDNAITDYNEALRLDPQYAPAYGYRGAAWDLKGDDARALTDFNEALRLDPKDVVTLLNRASFWGRKGEKQKMIRDFNEAVRLEPKYRFLGF